MSPLGMRVTLCLATMVKHRVALIVHHTWFPPNGGARSSRLSPTGPSTGLLFLGRS
jgi:hypothetical protein